MSIDRMQTFFRASRIGLPGVCLLMLWVGVTSAAPAGAPQEAVDALAGEERFDEAIALCREVVRDTKAPVSQRWALGRKAAEWLRRRQEKPDEAEKILERLLQLPLEPVQRAAVQRDLIYSAIHLIKPRDLDTVETRALALIEDSEAPAYLRGHAAIDLLNCFRAERNHEQKARPLPTIEKLLASDVLSARDEVRLRETLQRTLRDLGRAEAVLEQARIVVANTNAPAVQRVTACAELAEPLIERGDDAAAEELLRRSFAFPGLDAQGVARIVERIGRLYLLRDRMDEALEVYREAYRFFKTPEMTNRVVGLCAATLTDELRFE